MQINLSTGIKVPIIQQPDLYVHFQFDLLNFCEHILINSIQKINTG